MTPLSKEALFKLVELAFYTFTAFAFDSFIEVTAFIDRTSVEGTLKEDTEGFTSSMVAVEELKMVSSCLADS